MAISGWKQNAIRVMASLGVIYMAFVAYLILTTQDMEAIYKAFFLMFLTLLFPFIALVQIGYAVFALAGFFFAALAARRWVSERYMAAYVFALSLAWVIYGYTCMMAITGGA